MATAQQFLALWKTDRQLREYGCAKSQCNRFNSRGWDRVRREEAFKAIRRTIRKTKTNLAPL
jgi:hypothetical protein